MSSSRPILVGFDGSDDATAALDWAVREALILDQPVHVLYVAPQIAAMDAAASSLGGMPVVGEPISIDTAAVLEQARQRVAQSGVQLTTTSAVGAPARVLVEHSGRSSLVVLGSRGLGAAASLVLGSSVTT